MNQYHLPARQLAGFATLLFALLFSAGAAASIHPSAPSAAHDLEAAAHAVHDYLHDNYASAFGAHEFEEAAHALHGTLHDWSNGNATESRVVSDFEAVTAAWKDLRAQLQQSGLVHADASLETLFREAKASYKRVRFLLRKAGNPSFIHPSAPSAAHELEEQAHGLHEYIHANYTQSYGSHAFEDAAHELHAVLHHWSQAEATESEVAAKYTVLQDAWKDMRRQLRRARLLNGADEGLTERFEQTREAYRLVRRLLRKLD